MTLVAPNRDSMNLPDAFETALRNPPDEYDRIPEATVRRAASRLRAAFVELFAALYSLVCALIAVSVHHRASERVAEENDRAAYGVERSALALGDLLHGRLGRRFLGAGFLLMALGARKLGDPLCQIGLVVGWRDAGGGFSSGGVRKPRIRVVLSVSEQTDDLPAREGQADRLGRQALSADRGRTLAAGCGSGEDPLRQKRPYQLLLRSRRRRGATPTAETRRMSRRQAGGRAAPALSPSPSWEARFAKRAGSPPRAPGRGLDFLQKSPARIHTVGKGRHRKETKRCSRTT